MQTIERELEALIDLGPAGSETLGPYHFLLELGVGGHEDTGLSDD